MNDRSMIVRGRASALLTAHASPDDHQPTSSLAYVKAFRAQCKI